MSLESVTYVGDLVATNPTSSDPKSQGDDHIRNGKVALLNSFAGFTGAICVTGTDGGAANAYTLTPANALPAYGPKMITVFAPTVTNTGAATLNISGLGAKSIKRVDGSAVVSGDLVSGSIYAAIYNGTEFRLLSITKNYADQLAFSATLPNQLGNGAYLLTTDGTIASWTPNLNAGTIRFADSTDATKKLAFDVSGVTTATIRTATVPNYNGTLGLRAKGADVASAATVNLDTATGDFVHITGTTTITAITLSSGIERTVVFDAALTLTHNSTSLILPGGANITTAAGDRAIFRGEGSGNVRCIDYIKASGLAVVSPTQALTLLATLTPTAAANVDALSTFTSTYDNYLILGTGLLPAADDSLSFRFASAGAADAGSKYFGGSISATDTTTATSAQLCTATVISAGKGLSFMMNISNANDASNLKCAFANSVLQNNATPTLFNDPTWAAYNSANAISGIRFFWAGGSNFSATGKIRIYGYNNT